MAAGRSGRGEGVVLAETSEEVLRAVTSDWQLRLPASVPGHSGREERGAVLEGPGRRTERRACDRLRSGRRAETGGRGSSRVVCAVGAWVGRYSLSYTRMAVVLMRQVARRGLADRRQPGRDECAAPSPAPQPHARTTAQTHLQLPPPCALFLTRPPVLEALQHRTRRRRPSLHPPLSILKGRAPRCLAHLPAVPNCRTSPTQHRPPTHHSLPSVASVPRGAPRPGDSRCLTHRPSRRRALSLAAARDTPGHTTRSLLPAPTARTAQSLPLHPSRHLAFPSTAPALRTLLAASAAD